MSILHVSNEPLLEVTVKEKTLIKQLAEKYEIDLKGGRIREKYCEDIIIEHHGMTVADMELRDIIATLKYGIVSKDEEKRKILSDNIGLYANLQLAEYILMLSKALKNNAGIKVSTTIRSIPEKPIFINSSYNLHFLWLYANTMLEKQQKGVYQYTFYWKKKEQMKEEGYEQFKEPYTQEELKTIIKYEKEQKELKNGQKMLAGQIRLAVDLFRAYGIFKKNRMVKGIIKKRKELSSKEYQFLYDTLAVLGVFTKEQMETCSASDKKDAIRDYLRVRDKKT